MSPGALCAVESPRTFSAEPSRLPEQPRRMGSSARVREMWHLVHARAQSLWPLSVVCRVLGRHKARERASSRRKVTMAIVMIFTPLVLRG
jgi:hypothetical protein